MDTARAGSWRFSETVPEGPHVALYVRQALRLPVDPDDPPPLGSDSHTFPAVPDRTGLLRQEALSVVAEQWSQWWAQTLAAAAAEGARTGEDAFVGGADAPAQVSLADAPDLARVVAALLPEARAWAEGPRRISHPPLGTAHFPWPVVRAAVQEAAQAAQVPPETIQGSVLVLAVAGAWSVRLGPNSMACSFAAAHDETFRLLVLRDVLRRSAAGPAG